MVRFSFFWIVGVVGVVGCNVALPLAQGPTDGGAPAEDAVAADQQSCPPGDPCQLSDPCAIDPVCGSDGLCHPSAVQDCDDGLPCTEDTCLGQGLCENRPEPGSCVLPDSSTPPALHCFVDGDARSGSPCEVCDPSVDPAHWTPAGDGAACDDGQSCTSDDTCTGGQCLGTPYSCDDGQPCTDDGCDGNGGCLSPAVASGWCFIDDACYPDGDAHPGGSCATCDPLQSTTGWTVTSGCLVGDTCQATGALGYDGVAHSCGTCEPSQSTTSWTPKADTCFIDDQCRLDGEAHIQGCAKCDYLASSTSWTVSAGFCLIEDQCYNAGAVHPQGCAKCNPPTSLTSWSVVPGYCMINDECHAAGAADGTGCLVCQDTVTATGWTAPAGATGVVYGFESGATGWTLTGSDPKVGWGVGSKRAHGGAQSLSYGDPVAGNYAGSGANSGSASMPSVTITAGKKAALVFWLWMDVESTTGFDVLRVRVGGNVVWQKPTAFPMRQWHQVVVDLGAYAGQSVSPVLEFDTVDTYLNSTEGVFVDDVAVYHGC